MEDFNKEQVKSKPIQKEEYSSRGAKTVAPEYGVSKKAKKAAKATSIILTFVGAGLLLGSIFSFSWTYRTTAVVEQFKLTAGVDFVDYDIVIKNMSTETLTLKIHNQFMSEERIIIMGQNTGSFTGLTSGMQYKISILEKNVLVKSQTITTYLH